MNKNLVIAKQLIAIANQLVTSADGKRPSAEEIDKKTNR